MFICVFPTNKIFFHFLTVHYSIIKATTDFNDITIQKINEDFDNIEREINTPEIYDDERLSLEENTLKQKVN